MTDRQPQPDRLMPQSSRPDVPPCACGEQMAELRARIEKLEQEQRLILARFGRVAGQWLEACKDKAR